MTDGWKKKKKKRGRKCTALCIYVKYKQKPTQFRISAVMCQSRAHTDLLSNAATTHAVVVVAFSLLVRILGERATIYSPPALFLWLFFFFFFKW